MNIPLNESVPLKLRGKPPLRGIGTAATLFLGAILVAWSGGYRINLTPSEPLGLWRIVKLERAAVVGDLVFVCPPQTAAMREARSRGYLRTGLCPGSLAPLIKTVVAIAGQRIDVGANVRVDGGEIPRSTLANQDGKGRPMGRFVGGVVPADSIFLHSPFAGSYDSRYFGPVPSSGILGLAEEVLTYAP